MPTRVLIVEDSPTQAEALQAHLQSAGYEVEIAANGDRALELLSGAFDLVISDVVMPGPIDGYELCRRIKEGPFAALPVVLLTSLSDPLDIIRGLECGADNFLTKPYEADALLDRMDLLLRNRRLRSADRVRTGVKILFMGREYMITSEREQILDLLVTTFEEAVRQNKALRDREVELEAARAKLARYAGSLEGDLNRFFELSRDLICVVGFDGYFRRLNPAWERWLGWTHEELRANHCLDLVHPDDRAAAEQEMRRLCGGAGTGTQLNRCRSKDGSYRWLEWHAIALPDERLIYALARDVTDRTLAEAALQASEERYRLLFERHPQPLWLYDRETLRFLAVNEAAVEQYGYSREELLASTIEMIRPPEEVAALRDSLKSTPRGKGAPAIWRHRKRDGTVIEAEVRANDLDFLGRPARVVSSVDVTARLQAQRALETHVRQQAAVATLGQEALSATDLRQLYATASHQVAATLNAAVSGVLELGPGGRTLLLRAGVGWEEGIADLVALETEPGWQARSLFHVDPLESEGRAGLEASFGHSVLRGRPLSGAQVPIPTKERPFGMLAAARPDGQTFSQEDVHFLQALAHILASAIDRERAEAALRHTQRLESVGRLASGIAHDFNNLLTVILGEAELAATEIPDGDPVRSTLAEIEKAAHRAVGLTRQLLAFSRRETARPEILNLNEVIRTADKMLLRLIGEQIAREYHLQTDLYGVRMDRGLLEQILVNLVVNARDAMPEGGRLTIATHNVASEETNEVGGDLPAGDLVLLEVSDTGTGIPREVLEHIFDPFFTTKEQGKGTGLGLATCYGIITQAGGRVRVSSEPGAGTTFKVYLPRVPDDVLEIHGDVQAPVESAGEAVLLVEDDPGVRELVARLLASQKYRVLVASDPEDALRILTNPEVDVDLLLTDLVMPVMDGRALARRARDARPALRVLFCSGYAHDLNQALGPGERLLQKPFTAQSLALTIRELLDTVT